jgi:hypothetical protein
LLGPGVVALVERAVLGPLDDFVKFAWEVSLGALHDQVVVEVQVDLGEVNVSSAKLWSNVGPGIFTVGVVRGEARGVGRALPCMCHLEEVRQLDMSDPDGTRARVFV